MSRGSSARAECDSMDELNRYFSLMEYAISRFGGMEWIWIKGGAGPRVYPCAILSVATQLATNAYADIDGMLCGTQDRHLNITSEAVIIQLNLR